MNFLANPSFFVMISRAGGVVKRMDDDWGRRTPGVAILRQQMGDAAHRESSTFPCIGDAVMPAAWPLAYCPPDAFALPAVGTQGMANRPSPEEGTGTQAFLRKERLHPPEKGKVVLCFSLKRKEPDEVEAWGCAGAEVEVRGCAGGETRRTSKRRHAPGEDRSSGRLVNCL